MVLNDQAVRAAPPGIIWDDALKGFGLRTGKKTKSFIVLVASGRRKRIGRYPLLSVADARAAARKFLAEKTLGRVLPTHTAFEDAVEQFLGDRSVRPSTLAMYKWNLKRFKFGRKSVGDITPNDVLRSLKDLSSSNKEHAFRVGRTFFAWCFQQHFVDRSPMERMQPPAPGKDRDRVLSDEELKGVLKHARKFENGIQRLIWLLIKTGQRPGEIRRLKHDYLKPDRITLPAEITKNGREHTFPISKETYKAIKSFPTDSEYVFPAGRTHVRGKPVHCLTATSKARADFARECGVSGWTLHDLRRTYATFHQKLNPGTRLEVIEALLNHVSGTKAGVVGIYQRHDWFPEMVEALGRYEARLKRL
jgi:integrase